MSSVDVGSALQAFAFFSFPKDADCSAEIMSHSLTGTWLKVGADS